MSEYQYYEFLAVDRTLTTGDLKTIRTISSRAQITPTHFQNEYHFGDFHGDRIDFLSRFYDLHLYFANWGTHTFGIGLPLHAVDAAALKPYCPRNSTAECTTRGQRLILLFTSSSQADDFEDSSEPSLADLAPLREEILRGDLRPLYLGWLSGIFEEDAPLDDDTPEPPPPAGLQHLTPSQKSFAAFMRIDEDLLAVASRQSPPLSQSIPDPRPFISSLPQKDKDAFLAAVMEGRAVDTAHELQRLFRRTLPPPHRATNARTAGELRAAARSAAAARAKADAEDRDRRRAAEQARSAIDRANYLDSIAPTRANLWQQVEQLIATRLPKNYDQAVQILSDLRDLARRHEHLPEYDRNFAAVRDRHKAKTTLLHRFRKATLL